MLAPASRERPFCVHGMDQHTLGSDDGAGIRSPSHPSPEVFDGP